MAVLSKHFPRVSRMEIVEAELCRPELLVELEGVADVAPRPITHS